MSQLKLWALAAALCIFDNMLWASTANDETIVFTPQWTAQAQFAGYYVAESKGFYREAGVKVRIEHPSATQPASAASSSLLGRDVA